MTGPQPEPEPGADWRQTFAEALAEHAREEAARPRKHRVEGRKPEEMDPASGWLEAEDFEAPLAEGEIDEGRDRRRRTFTRQVGIRLSHNQYAELSRAADLYGVAPGTMARMLVRRGARSILDARRRYDLELDG
jgi:hypothetical protein